VTKTRILVVDDDVVTRKYLGSLLASLGYAVEEAESGEEALSRIAATSSPPALVVLDLLLGGMSGLEVLDQLRRTSADIPVIVLSGSSPVRTVVDAVRCGAVDYLTKPVGAHDLALALKNALDKQELPPGTPPDRHDTDLVSSNPQMARVKEIARQVADTDAPVLLLGETGVGKEVVARYVHGQSRRARQPLVKVNCAALPEDLLESELFGYERGAFSGALREKPGLFELADKGSILLDEIGEMTPHLQAKLLHVLQDGEFLRLGGRQRMRVDARVFASTNIHMEEAVAAGRFREDLYFRLNIIRIDIPPLRERRDDIPMLCAHFMRSYSARYHSAPIELPRELREAFVRYDWPGNVRELENAVRRYVILPDVEVALSHFVSGPRLASPGPRPAEETAPNPGAAAPEVLSLRRVGAQAAEDAERELLRRALAETRWNRKEAASLLHISYKALLNKLKKWEVDAPGDAGRPRPSPPVLFDRSAARRPFSKTR
jgi:two-component system response regulator AtoC